MRIVRQGQVVVLALAETVVLATSLVAQPSPDGRPPNLQPQAEQLFALANQARAAQGVGPLKWDPALAAAALQHCQRMAQEGQIAHRYGGEPDLTARAGQAGAHFSLIEENVALGSYVASIHDGWMQSQGHRANLLNPDADRVGIAVVASRGVFYAVADFARAVAFLNQAQVEAAIAGLLRARGVMLLQDTADARAYCSNGSKGNSGPSFLMVWQNPDVTRLPQPLVDRLAAGRYRKAQVGNCPPQDVEGSFTIYRVAVLLY